MRFYKNSRLKCTKNARDGFFLLSKPDLAGKPCRDTRPRVSGHRRSGVPTSRTDCHGGVAASQSSRVIHTTINERC